MKLTGTFSHTELLQITKAIHDRVDYEDAGTFEVELKIDNFDVFINFDYFFDTYCDPGSYDVPPYYERQNECYEIRSITFYDKNGEELNFNIDLNIDIKYIQDQL